MVGESCDLGLAYHPERAHLTRRNARSLALFAAWDDNAILSCNRVQNCGQFLETDNQRFPLERPGAVGKFRGEEREQKQANCGHQLAD